MTLSWARNLLVALAAVAGMPLTSDAQRGPDRNDIFAQYKRAIVSLRVIGVDVTGQPKTQRGTGVLVSDKWVVTARHVVGVDSSWQESPSGPNRRIEVYSIEPNGRMSLLSKASARLSFSDDIAVLILDTKGDECAPLSNSSVSDEPKTLVGLFWGRRTEAPDSLSVDTLTKTPGTGDRVVINYAPIDGDSGSPLFDASGYVVAILSGDGADRPQTSVAVPAYLAKGLLPGDVACKRPASTAGASSDEILPNPWRVLEPQKVDAIKSGLAAVTSAPFPGTFVVSVDRYWSEPTLIAQRIVFEPRARLIFKESGSRTSRDITLVAEEIRSLSQENPGVISWEDVPSPAAPTRGVARSGVPGVGDGARGGDGENGGPGSTGSAGRDGPRLTMLVNKTINPIVVDVSGGTGGSGGGGEEGGAGGPGAPGRRASSSAFDCKSGPGDGGRGGNGGRGGGGGAGGPGGHGGSLVLLTAEPNIHAINRVVLRMLGGGGGPGGPQASGGRAGPGGPRGAAAPPFCRDDARNGDPGTPGLPGQSGEQGRPGADGSAFVASISADEVLRLVSR